MSDSKVGFIRSPSKANGTRSCAAGLMQLTAGMGRLALRPRLVFPPIWLKRLVIDEVAGTKDVRSRQGAWGILSRDLVTRAMSFEVALIAAFAPFYNKAMYTDF